VDRPSVIVTTQGQDTDGAEPRVPSEICERLLRKGFVKVDCKGSSGPDVYIASGEIDRVQDNVVHLLVTVKDVPSAE
jgi:hypothetical protein